MLTNRLEFLDLPKELSHQAFARAVAVGLSQSPKSVPCRFFYDAEGSRLFEQICHLHEYYLTRAEQALLESHANAMIQTAGAPTHLVEFGSGSSRKTRLLLESALRSRPRIHYTPIDISSDFLRHSCIGLLQDYENLHIEAISAEYRDALNALLPQEEPRLFLLMGSNIGNFEPGEAIQFLGLIRAQMTPRDRLMLGVDLLKAVEVLHAAYNDAQGITAQFNRNLLSRINRELEGDFNLSNFKHDAPFLPDKRCIEMRLISQIAQTIRIEGLGITVEFEAGEPIITEHCYKYSPESFHALCEAAGFETIRCWQYDPQPFLVALLKSL